jgi:hypothetical protein
VPGFSLFPLKHHFRPEKEILVKQIADPLGELKSLEVAPSAFQVDPQRFKRRLLDELRERLHHPPGHQFGIKEVWFWEGIENVVKDLLDKGVGKRETAVGANSVSFCKLQTYPPLHALALNHNHLRVKGGRQGLLEHTA